MHILMSFFEENEWLIYILIKALKMTWKKFNGPKIHAFTTHVKYAIGHMFKQKNQYYVQYNYAYYIQQTERQMLWNPPIEATGGTEALTDCDK